MKEPNLSRGSVPALFLLIFTLAGFSAQLAVDLKTQLSELVQAEISFAKISGEQGIRDAFLAFLAERSLVFRPMPVDGRKTYEQSAGDEGSLSWFPVIADISRTGDLGYTTGPYEYRGKNAGDPTRHGNYASVWRRQPDGAWKVILDCGTPNPAPPARPAPWQPPSVLEPVFSPAGLRLDPAVQRKKLQDTDLAFATMSWERGASLAYQNALSSSARLLRPGMLPISGKQAIVTAMARRKPIWTWRPADAGTSSGGDLGYTCRKMSAAGGETG
jgi:ketosteroid isomerase-like protein